MLDGCTDIRVQGKASYQEQSKALHDSEPVYQKDIRMPERTEGLTNKLTTVFGNVNSVNNDQFKNRVGEGIEDMDRDIDLSNRHIKFYPGTTRYTYYGEVELF